MTTTKNSGNCLLCEQNIEHRFMVRHINKCLANDIANETSEKEKIFLFKVSDKASNGKLFWLYIEINGSAKLDMLDSFLRDIWLECCGHMSNFNIKGEGYASDGEMNKTIHRLFDVNTEFDYEYDFGSTTMLEGKVMSIRPGRLQKTVRLLARNNLPDIVKCCICNKHPSDICSACYDFFCNKCKKKHKNCEGEEYMLPVVNSPRMGVCGYCGPENE